MAELIAKRPSPGRPRPFEFPRFTRAKLDSGFQIIAINVPNRPLGAAYLILEAGASSESAEVAGAASLAAQALVEGTENYDGADFIDAAERLGADIRASAGWDALTAVARVPMTRMEPALELLAEAVRRPTFPPREVERLKQQRLNQLMQEFANPTQRAFHAFDKAVYSTESAYSRPAGGSYRAVEALDQTKVADFYRTHATPASATLIIAGDIEGFPLQKIVENYFGDWSLPEPLRRQPKVAEAIIETSVTLVNRPGSVQSEVVMGHQGLPRLIPDYHAVSLMIAGLGGLFNSRLNLKLREEKGYTYGASALNDYRRDAGPFRAWAAVQTAVTKDAIADTLEILRRTHDEGLTQQELDDARDFLVGVFPLRFETPESLAAALSQIVIYGLPDDYYDTYRPDMERVSIDDVKKAAAERLRLDKLAIVVVGDASVVGDPLEKAAFGPVTVVEDPPPGEPPE